MENRVQLLDKSQNVIVFDGNALISKTKNNGFIVSMKSNQSQMNWKIYPTGLIIESIADYKVVLTLRPNSTTKGHIETEYGIIDLHCKTSLYKINENCIEVQYDLIQGNDIQVFHFKLNLYGEESLCQRLMFN